VKCFSTFGFSSLHDSRRLQDFGMTLWSSKDEEFWTTWIHKLDSDDLFFRHNLTFLGEVF
jgi:uncharacterized protein YlbG (UPF0298 family)